MLVWHNYMTPQFVAAKICHAEVSYRIELTQWGYRHLASAIVRVVLGNCLDPKQIRLWLQKV